MHSLYTPRSGRVQVLNKRHKESVSILKRDSTDITNIGHNHTPRTRVDALGHRNLVGLRSKVYHHSRVTADNDDLDDHAYDETTHCDSTVSSSVNTLQRTRPQIPPRCAAAHTTARRTAMPTAAAYFSARFPARFPL